MTDTSNKIVLVTGASRGIGQSIAQQLGLAGMTVIGTATSAKGATHIEQKFAESNIAGCGMVLNVCQLESITQTIKKINEQFGPPLVLINNAGITEDNLLLRLKNEQWDRVIETNLTAVMRMCRSCLKGMMKARWGRIINIGSVVGATGNPGQANYAAAKAGMEGFTKSLAQEIGSRGITVNVLAPGFIATDMTHSLPEQQRAALLNSIPLGRLGQPEDIAAAALFLASAGASYISGQTLHVNGGMYMN